MKRVTWEEFFMAQSHLLAVRSTCNRLSVGATIVRDHRIVASGYNGSISGGDHCVDVGCHVVDNHCVRTIHAEMNALLQCAKYGISTKGATIYVTHFPCLQCTKSLIQAGIERVYYAEDYRNDPFAIQLLMESGVHVQKIAFDARKIDTQFDEKLTLIHELLQEVERHAPQSTTLDSYKERVEQLFGVHIES